MKILRATLAVLLLLGGAAFACDSTVVEFGVESRSQNTMLKPYFEAQCNVLIEPLTLTTGGSEESDTDVEWVSTWIRPSVYLTPNVEFSYLKLDVLVDVPWTAQFVTTLQYGLRDGYLLQAGYRQVF